MPEMEIDDIARLDRVRSRDLGDWGVNVFSLVAPVNGKGKPASACSG